MFDALPVSSGRSGRGAGLGLSAAIHLAVVAALVLLPLLARNPPPEPRRSVDVFFYDPPPPPSPPPLRGSALPTRRPPAGVPEQSQRLQAPVETPKAPESIAAPEPAAGRDEGSPLGLPEGMEGGVEGGVVGGVLGGVVGGVLGGTGSGPVPVPLKDLDRPPRPIRMPKPEYPPEAFVKKVQGVVLVEILIDASGRVASARILQSIPILDAAALQAVRTRTFQPAIRRGEAVATTALAPVAFRIY